MEHGKQQIYDKERVQWNTAFLKKGGDHFEVVIDPDEALEFHRTGGKSDIKDCLKSEHVFSDAKRGLIASEERCKELFGTTEALEIAKRIILEGEIQISAEHRAKLRAEKLNRIITRIQSYAVDPKTGSPHPRKRIELAFEEAKIKIDERADAESQIKDIVKRLQPIIPIKLETVVMQVHLPNPYGQKLYGELERFGTLKKTDWMADGGLLAWVEIPAGLQNDLAEEFGGKTHGGAEIKKVDENPL